MTEDMGESLHKCNYTGCLTNAMAIELIDARMGITDVPRLINRSNRKPNSNVAKNLADRRVEVKV